MKTYLSIALLAVTLSGCSSKEQRQFVSGCKMGGVEGSTCKCIYKKLEKKYGKDDLVNQLYTMEQSQSFQNDMIQAGYQCMKE
ncbi:hypothetical protein [Acinetobacter populi]|uniref:Lipoprotein n=1 Tax=Acinetobacter populi TaxID=1582270 RepID=A0A1Z9YZ39_9GAMM|nr:hypothetical protein [Acinetobacter populi]OUY07432.1 hypothetical protein CAP51_06660 [Acinetobacter populi]